MVLTQGKPNKVYFVIENTGRTKDFRVSVSTNHGNDIILKYQPVLKVSRERPKYLAVEFIVLPTATPDKSVKVHVKAEGSAPGARAQFHTELMIMS